MKLLCDAGFEQDETPCYVCGATSQQSCRKRHDDPRDQIIKDLRAENERLREFVEEVRRSGDTRLASMAIAVLAAKGE